MLPIFTSGSEVREGGMPGFGTAAAAPHTVAVRELLAQRTHHLAIQMRKETKMFRLVHC